MRALPALVLMVVPTMSHAAEDLTGKDWQLVAIDGLALTAAAKLRIEAGRAVFGKPPCNRWSAANRAVLPKLDPGAIRSTRMACDEMEKEQAFFSTLAAMTEAGRDRGGRLILTGPDGRTMTFVPASGPASGD